MKTIIVAFILLVAPVASAYTLEATYSPPFVLSGGNVLEAWAKSLEVKHAPQPIIEPELESRTYTLEGTPEPFQYRAPDYSGSQWMRGL